MATHSSVLAWEIPWTEEPRGLWSMRLQTVGHYWSEWAHKLVWGQPSRLVERLSTCSEMGLRRKLWARDIDVVLVVIWMIRKTMKRDEIPLRECLQRDERQVVESAENLYRYWAEEELPKETEIARDWVYFWWMEGHVFFQTHINQQKNLNIESWKH